MLGQVGADLRPREAVRMKYLKPRFKVTYQGRKYSAGWAKIDWSDDKPKTKRKPVKK